MLEQLRDESRCCALRCAKLADATAAGIGWRRIARIAARGSRRRVCREMKQIRALDRLDIIAVPGRVLDRIANQH